MAKHQIFLLHGMGNFEPGWSEVIRERIGDAFARYPRLRDNGFANDFEFKEITYNHVFEAWRRQWAEDAERAAGALVADGLNGGVAKQLVELAGGPAGDGFARTHLLDVVAYRFLLPVAQEIWRSVQNQTLGHLKSLPRDDALHFSIVAHSLGTAVAYEAWHAMMTQGADGQAARLGSAFKPDFVFLVANVVKPLWNRGGSAYPAVMAPSLSAGDGWCFRLASIGHALDPFARLDRFDPPDGWFTQMAPRSEVYVDVQLPAKDLQDENVHAFEHYLGHPLVHVPMLRTLTGFDGGVTKKELEAALDEWRSRSLPAQKLARAQSRLADLAVEATSDWSRELDMLRALREIARTSRLTGGES